MCMHAYIHTYANTYIQQRHNEHMGKLGRIKLHLLIEEAH
jgi:hypothetical protein